MKVCSLYGAGFYYMPGTDMCIKIGGFTRAEITWGDNGNSTTGVWSAVDYNNRYTNNFWSRYRGYITADAREETAYGVARGYIAVGAASQNTGGEANSGQFSANRLFVQWAGFTAGQTVSFYDFMPVASELIRGGMVPSYDTGDGGWWVWAYTAQLGGGVTATLSAEERRMSQILGFSGTAASAALNSAGAIVVTPANAVLLGGPTTPGTNGSILATATSGNGYGGWQSPDIVGVLRVDQTWGSAQIAGVAHEVNAAYYGATPVTGHPADAWGWVVGGGVKLNTPFISQGDYIWGFGAYTNGALKYLWHSHSGLSETGVLGANEGFGVGSDCVYGGTLAGLNNTSCQLTTAWQVLGAYRHYWTPQWSQTLVGSYEAVSYNTSANAMLCVGETTPTAAGLGAGAAGTNAVAPVGCNNNWSAWGVGSQLKWDVTKSFYIGVEALYTKLQSASLPGGLLTAATTEPNSGAIFVSNIDNWAFSIRMEKDFLP